jgi:sodium-dependent dicarboxylate transporter 2/3/5
MDLQQTVRRIGLVTGPMLALLLYLTLPHEYRGSGGAPAAFSPAARATMAMMVWMATWWMTEAVEIEVTSLLPIVTFPLFGIMSVVKTTANYGGDVIFVFLGGFLLALAIQRWGLDRHIAFRMLQ